MPEGINISPGSSDDGWKSPPAVELSDGSYVQLYKDGEALLAAYNAIKRAAHRICLEVYIFADDETGRAFASLLAEKARQGVKVYVIYDDFGSAWSDRKMFRQMREAGVNLAKFHPLRPWQCQYGWRPFNRDHRKLLVIDHDTAGLGGLNIAGEYAGRWVVANERRANDPWRDTAIGVRGPAAQSLLDCFGRTWNYIRSRGRINRTQMIELAPNRPVGVVATAPTMHSPLRPLLHDLFRSARTSIDLTMAYFAPDDELVEVLCTAGRRGVGVRLMLPNRSDVPAVVMAARSFYEKLMRSGVEVYERQGAILHAKSMVIDRRLSVLGSMNLDYRSIEYNLELSVLVHSEPFAEQMVALFDHDVQFSRRICPEEWNRRHWQDRLGQWAVSRARYLL
jgi:cardiolipin synthase